MKKKSKVNKALIAASLFITIITISTPVMAAGSNRFYFISVGEDLDIPRTTNFIIGTIKSGDEPSARVLFYSKICDESGKKMYEMSGMLEEVYFIDTGFSFFCPLYKVWFINVWQVMGQGKVRTTDANVQVYFRDLFTITMPNTEGEVVSAPMLVLLSPTAEYREGDPINGPTGPVKIWEQGKWALVAVIWYVPEIDDVFPIGPLTDLTISIGTL